MPPAIIIKKIRVVGRGFFFGPDICIFAAYMGNLSYTTHIKYKRGNDMTLSNKEQMLVKDLMAAEKLSIDKYIKSSSEAKELGLKNLFSDICKVEQSHLNELQTIMSGADSQAALNSAPAPTVPETVSYDNDADKNADAYLCQDGLSGEKQISGMYEVSVFEFAQPPLRKILNKIQSEEQSHGQFFYEYMTKANMNAG